MGYFNFYYEDIDDPRVQKLCRSLRLAIPYGLGHWSILKAWASSEKHRAFLGDLSPFTPEQLHKAAGFTSDAPTPVELTKALIDSELVIRDTSAPTIKAGEPLGGQATIAGWIDICGEATKRRIERHSAASDAIGQASDDWLTELLSGGYTKSNNKTNNVYKVFLVYKYVKKDKDKEAVKTDKRWDLINSGRQMPWCKKLLQACEGDLKRAADAVLGVGTHFENIGFSWDCSTVHKKLTDYEEGRLQGR